MYVEFKVYQNFHFPLGNTKTLEHSENIAPLLAYFLSLLCVLILSLFFSETTKYIVPHNRHTSTFRSTCAFVTVFALHSVLCVQPSIWGHFPSARHTTFRVSFADNELSQFCMPENSWVSPSLWKDSLGRCISLLWLL